MKIQSCSEGKAEAGVALILVLFIVTLASIIVINITYTSSLEARSNLATERSLKAEYLLKSAISFAQTMIKQDVSPSVDGQQDLWAKFAEGAPLDPSWFGINDPAARIWLEIRAADSKLNIRIVDTNQMYRIMLVHLFRELGFDSDEEEDHTGLFPNRVFTSEELVANLIDYIDDDADDFQDPNFPATGIDEQIPKDYFPNLDNKTDLQRIGELSLIPGFTPTRVRRMMPFVRVVGQNKININLAPKVVLRSLERDLNIDEITDTEVDAIDAFRNGPDGPFGEQNPNLYEQLVGIIGQTLAQKISPALDTNSADWQVIAKVDYGVSTFFIRAHLAQGASGDLPEIQSFELY